MVENENTFFDIEGFSEVYGQSPRVACECFLPHPIQSGRVWEMGPTILRPPVAAGVDPSVLANYSRDESRAAIRPSLSGTRARSWSMATLALPAFRSGTMKLLRPDVLERSFRTPE